MYIFLYRTQSSVNRQTEDLMLSGRSFMKMRNRTGPRTDPWGTSDSTGTGSEVWPSKGLAIFYFIIKLWQLKNTEVCVEKTFLEHAQSHE